jgi:hypothetical protein
VGQVSDKAVELLDPHGDTKGEEVRKYDLNLKSTIDDLIEHIEGLNKELSSSNYKSYSISVSEQLDFVFDKLKIVGGKTALNKLRINWKRLKNRKEGVLTEKHVTGLRPKSVKNISMQLDVDKKALLQEDIGKGFDRLRDELIEDKQNVSYKVLLKYYESIRINKFL